MHTLYLTSTGLTHYSLIWKWVRRTISLYNSVPSVQFSSSFLQVERHQIMVYLVLLEKLPRKKILAFVTVLIAVQIVYFLTGGLIGLLEIICLRRIRESIFFLFFNSHETKPCSESRIFSLPSSTERPVGLSNSAKQLPRGYTRIRCGTWRSSHVLRPKLTNDRLISE